MPWCPAAVKVHIQVKQIRPSLVVAFASLSDIVNLRRAEEEVRSHDIHRITLRVCFLETCDQLCHILIARFLLHILYAFFCRHGTAVIRRRREGTEFAEHTAYHQRNMRRLLTEAIGDRLSFIEIIDKRRSAYILSSLLQIRLYLIISCCQLSKRNRL